MTWKRTLLAAFGLAMFLAVLIPPDASAIPAFARRYKLSCTTCHAPVPRLKDYGEEFAGAGFVIQEEEKDRDYVSAGDDLLWLNRVFQLGVRFDAYALFEDGREGDLNPVESDLQIPWGIKVLSGGALYKNIGYYFYFYMSERGEVAGVEDAYVHFDDVGGASLDIMVGQFQTSDPLMKRELRLSFEDYQIYKERIGNSGTNLAYDRGVMLVYGHESTSTDLVGFVVNGNGREEAGDDHRFDADKYKNFGARISQGIGDIASIGGYYYYGKERIVWPAAVEEDRQELEGPASNEVVYYGPDLSVSAGPLTLTGQYLMRTDSNPGFLTDEPDADTETEGYIAELVVSPQGDDGRHFLTLLYNRIDSDIDHHDYETFTVNASYLLARNLKLIAEYTRDIEEERNRAVLGFVSGF